MTDVIARFVGNQEDTRTKLMGIKYGKKYQVSLKDSSWLHKFLYKIDVLAEIQTKKGLIIVPYSNRDTFFLNWKIKKI